MHQSSLGNQPDDQSYRSVDNRLLLAERAGYNSRTIFDSFRSARRSALCSNQVSRAVQFMFPSCKGGHVTIMNVYKYEYEYVLIT